VTDFDIPLSDSGWREALKSEFERPDYQRMVSFLRSETERGAIVYPPKDLIFNAFNLTPLSKVKVVILGQDPYHGPGQAMGLSFSVPAGVKLPPSLKNIFAEIQNDIGGELRMLGALDDWARQGVLLLNTVLTVENGLAASHAKKGWEAFTDGAIRQLSAQRRGIVYMLWGSHAQKKISLINNRDNRVLTAPHPSPLSAYRGFLGCKHFSKANHYLEECGDAPIRWAGQPAAR
jgi:uracil-DNA glycosylase